MLSLLAMAAIAGAVGAPALARRKLQADRDAVLPVDKLRAIMPALPLEKAVAYQGPLTAALREFDLTTPRRMAAFLAQVGFESAQLRYFEEIASGEAYEGRANLGNTQPGDGVRYKGRGPIQLTGRANYRTAGVALRLPLEERPELAAFPEVGFRIAGWFWVSRNLNEYADRGTDEDFREITRRINGGYNGHDQRVTFWRRATQVLGGVS